MLDVFNMYGSKFNFTIFNKPKYYTIVGLVCSIITVLLMIVFSYLFGSDFLFRLNPQIIYSKNQPMKNRIYNMTSDVLYLPWRVHDMKGDDVEFEKMLYPVLRYETYTRDPETNRAMHSEKRLSYIKCSNKMNYSVNIPFNIEDYYCFDFEQLNIGGDIDSESYTFISLSFSYCPNGDGFTNDKCDLGQALHLNDILDSNNSLSFSVLVPEHNFEPDSPTNPLRIIYKQKTMPLTLFTIKDYHFSFQYAKMIDDKGLIIPNVKELTKFSLYDELFQFKISDFFYFNEFTTTFFKVEFSMNKANNVYSRRYPKLPEVIANISGLMRIIILLFEMLCLFVNDSFLYASLIRLFFDFDTKHLNEQHIKLKESSQLTNNIDIPKQNISLGPIVNNLVTERKTGTMKVIKLNSSSKIKRKMSLSSYYLLIKYMMIDSCFKRKYDLNSSVQNQAFSRASKAIMGRIEIVKLIKQMNQGNIIFKELIQERRYKQLYIPTKANPYKSDEVNYIYQLK